MLNWHVELSMSSQPARRSSVSWSDLSRGLNMSWHAQTKLANNYTSLGLLSDHADADDVVQLIIIELVLLANDDDD